MKCPNCKSEISDEALFCSECGTKIEKTEKPVHSRVAKREQQKQNQNKQILTIVAIVVLVAVILLGCYFLFFKGDNTKEKTSTTTSEKTETSTKQIKLDNKTIILLSEINISNLEIKLILKISSSNIGPTTPEARIIKRIEILLSKGV